jgi:aspartate racemase
MKKIGILGGMSPESTTLYYQHITRTYTARFGDYGYPEILIYSVNFQKFVDWQHNGQWNEAALLRVHRISGADIAGVESTGHGGVLRSLHDHAAIRKHRQLVRVE